VAVRSNLEQKINRAGDATSVMIAALEKHSKCSARKRF
jgi:hypothetical protein